MEKILKKTIDIARAKFMLACKGVSKNVSIPLPPKQWEKFPLSTSCWKEVDFNGENVTACLYKVKEKEKMFHSHEKHGEHITIMSPTGTLRVITNKGDFTYSFPDSVYIPADTPHYIEMSAGLLLQIVWNPKMERWSADNYTL